MACVLHIQDMNSQPDAVNVTLVIFGAVVRLTGINRFYSRRVMQRWHRGEIDAVQAVDLLIAAAQRGESIGVRRRNN